MTIAFQIGKYSCKMRHAVNIDEIAEVKIEK